MNEKGQYHCPVEAALAVIGGKWKTLIIWQLKDGCLRFTQLMDRMPMVSPRMLTKQLRELEDDGVITRTMYPEVPPRVEYSLTDLGASVIPVLESLCAWGSEYLLHNGCPLPEKKCQGTPSP
ncbi:MAG TPA: helix-turn-helix domain-containing protein [Methanospirillum sp.]|uniref:winged helix-turn-helix transcriptional regulator n=1 Tax=Methanospirillum sp. TaxID=45200 RepID=UPI002C4D7EC2|nr:helix-turn-helix domain-containing protein [Methanospirillum sp.]HOJ96693.1 helix-turn-helix domain-containing protein [Methanospirillum sp.]HOL40315.1 helix-turn-helix domain-containing protein [Methanospirillum sp.]HPP78715.1 helix-turn-helix domain-containing protein [Methanospirillum sp.]